MSGFENQIRSVLRTRARRLIEEQSLARAAVLFPLFVQEGQPSVLLTKRTELVRHHKGQISFPGGAQDQLESLETTALRETEEELGISPNDVQILGRFHDYLSSSNFRVAVFVGLLSPGFTTRPSDVEVEQVLAIPLNFFLTTEPEIRRMQRRGVEGEVYFYNWKGHTVWGLTARIIKEFCGELRLTG